MGFEAKMGIASYNRLRMFHSLEMVYTFSGFYSLCLQNFWLDKNNLKFIFKTKDLLKARNYLSALKEDSDEVL